MPFESIKSFKMRNGRNIFYSNFDVSIDRSQPLAKAWPDAWKIDITKGGPFESLSLKHTNQGPNTITVNKSMCGDVLDLNIGAAECIFYKEDWSKVGCYVEKIEVADEKDGFILKDVYNDWNGILDMMSQSCTMEVRSYQKLHCAYQANKVIQTLQFDITGMNFAIACLTSAGLFDLSRTGRKPPLSVVNTLARGQGIWSNGPIEGGP